MRPYKANKSQSQWLRDLADSGASARDIAYEFGISESDAIAICDTMGVVLQPPGEDEFVPGDLLTPVGQIVNAELQRRYETLRRCTAVRELHRNNRENSSVDIDSTSLEAIRLQKMQKRTFTRFNKFDPMF